MRPRRDVFARDYITETIEFYEEAVARQCQMAPGTMEQSEMDWAHDVLTEYFRVAVGKDPVVHSARRRFEETGYQADSTGERFRTSRSNSATWTTPIRESRHASGAAYGGSRTRLVPA